MEETEWSIEQIIELSWLLNSMEILKRVSVSTREEGKAAIIETAEGFENTYDDSDWCELDYLEEIQRYGEEQFMIRFGIE